MRRHFLLRDYECYQFAYPTRRNTIGQSADQLRYWLLNNHISNYHMVCHSMGGLLCHAYLSRYGEDEHAPETVVCLGSPLKGSMVARNLTRSVTGRFLLGVQCRSELVDGVQEWPAFCPVGIIAGNRNIGAGRLLGLDSSKPGDGTISVEETGIPGVTDRIILPVTHSQMTFSSKVFRQIEYFNSHRIFKH